MAPYSIFYKYTTGNKTPFHSKFKISRTASNWLVMSRLSPDVMAFRGHATATGENMTLITLTRFNGGTCSKL